VRSRTVEKSTKGVEQHVVHSASCCAGGLPGITGPTRWSREEPGGRLKAPAVGCQVRRRAAVADCVRARLSTRPEETRTECACVAPPARACGRVALRTP
jgi:hypothetical protein